MPHMDWCGKPCGDCKSPCALDKSMPCGPGCDCLLPNGERNTDECARIKCNAYEEYASCKTSNGLKSRIKELRRIKGISAPALAEKLGKAESTVRTWETGRAKPDADTLINLAEIFECSVDYLLGVDNKYLTTGEFLKPKAKVALNEYQLLITRIDILSKQCSEVLAVFEKEQGISIKDFLKIISRN